MADGKIICAVDFGTTYSGVAYAYVENGQDPKDVSVELIEDHWPGMGSRSSAKVPSVFKFDKTVPGGFKWGFQLDNDPDKICFAKLYLDPGQINAAETLAKFSKKLGKLPPNRSVMDGISKFLEAIRTVAIDRMESEWGKDFVESTPIEAILTVPAVWSDKAKSDTLLCAHRAGFGPIDKIRLIAEPEAAAVYTFHQLPDISLKKGDIFITCDAGGGTVDLTTYQVFETTPILRVDEVTVGDGALCGSVYLNRRFEEMIQTKIGSQLNKLPKSEALEIIAEMQRVFDEYIKINFGTTDDEDTTYEVPVPDSIEDNPELNINSGSLVLSMDDLRTVFDPVIGAIVRLINEQLDQIEKAFGRLDISSILLVGGFGSSEYLRREIEKHFSGDDEMPQIKILQPQSAWSAVTRGAMLRGLQGDIVETRIIRHHYGIQMKETWDSNIHEAPDKRRTAESNKVWDTVEQKHFCSKVMRWYVKKGDKFTSKKVVSFNFYRALTDLSNMIFETGLVIYTGSGTPPYFRTSDCREIATVKADLSAIPASNFEVVNSGNGNWYKVSYDIEMSFEATLSFRLVFQGKILGECGVDYGR